MDTEATDVVRRHFLFGGLDDAQFELLTSSARLVSLSNGEFLFRRGEDARRFFLVVDGQIQLFLTSSEGDQKVVAVFSSGQTFAEAVMFMEKSSYPVNASAIGDTVVYGFSNADFMENLRQSPDLCFRLLGDVCQRLHGRLREVEYLTLKNATHRLVRFLTLQLPETDRDEAVIELTTSRQIIASRLSMKPETLSRLMKNLVEAGILGVDGKRISVRSISALREYE